VDKPIGILGGSFDPVHYGHLRPAQDVLRALQLSEVRLIPVAQSPHRSPPQASAEHRWHMLELAISDFPNMCLDDRELRRGGLSYTVPTLESLRAQYGQRPLCLLMGQDAFNGIELWHQWQRLPDLAHLVVMTRPGTSTPHVDQPGWMRDCLTRDAVELNRSSAGKLYFQTVSSQDISSTRIRESLARGDSIDGLVPPNVREYLSTHRIYQDRKH